MSDMMKFGKNNWTDLKIKMIESENQLVLMLGMPTVKIIMFLRWSVENFRENK